MSGTRVKKYFSDKSDDIKQVLDAYESGHENGYDEDFVMNQMKVISECKNFHVAYDIYREMDVELLNEDEARSIGHCIDKIACGLDSYDDFDGVHDEDYNSCVHSLSELYRDENLDISNESKMNAFATDVIRSGNLDGFKQRAREALSDPAYGNSFNTGHMLEKGADVGLNAYNYRKSDFSFTDGENQIDFHGKVIESGYEMFVGAESVYENGELLYDRDATCVDNYHNETYTRGKFDNMSDVIDYIKEKYPDTTWQNINTPYPKVDKVYESKWENKAYAAKQEAKKNGTYLDRVVFADKGIFTNKDGKKYHAVDFAYACDQKGDNDKAVANPYLMSSKKKDLDGTLRTVHSYYLSDEIYNRLNEYANKDGIGDTSRWSGVINAKVGYPTTRNGKSKRSVDLTTAALNRDEIRRPDVPFDEEKHNRFVKKSLAAVRKQRADKAAEISDGIEAGNNMEAESQMG